MNFEIYIQGIHLVVSEQPDCQGYQLFNFCHLKCQLLSKRFGIYEDGPFNNRRTRKNS